MTKPYIGKARVAPTKLCAHAAFQAVRAEFESLFSPAEM